jgi:hypothetical protein
VASILEEGLWKSNGQEWIRTTEGVKPADLQSVALRGKRDFVGQKSAKMIELDIPPVFWLQLGGFIPKAKTKDWPRVRKALNGAGQTMWIVDLRPHGKRKYFSSKNAPLESLKSKTRCR